MLFMDVNLHRNVPRCSYPQKLKSSLLKAAFLIPDPGKKGIEIISACRLNIFVIFMPYIRIDLCKFGFHLE